MTSQYIRGLDATELPDYTCMEDEEGVQYMTLHGVWAKEADLPEEVLARKYSPKFPEQFRIDQENNCFLRKYGTPEKRGRGRPPKEGSRLKKR